MRTRNPARKKIGCIGYRRRTLAVYVAILLFATGCAHKRTSQAVAPWLAHHHEIIDRGPAGPSSDGGDSFHDSCLALVNVGDASSVPHLIRALSFFYDVEIKGTNMGIICTQAHCVAALERITGAKVGVSYSSWKQWWDEMHPGQPIEPAPGYKGKQPQPQNGANDGPTEYYRAPVPAALQAPDAPLK